MNPQPKTLMIGVSGIRGVVGSGLTPTVLTELASSFAAFARPGPLVLARDTRPSGVMARHAVLAGLFAMGRKVIDLGVVPTPTAQLAVEDHRAAGGLVITASHNPPAWNALKFIGPQGIFLGPREGKRFLAIYAKRRWRLRSYHSLGAVEEDRDAVERHGRRILALPEIAPEKIRRAGFRVALDCVNGAGAVLMPRFLADLGCHVETIYGEPSGLFGRGTEPVPRNLRALGDLVRRTRGDIGFALDPDGDRLALVDCAGNPLGEESTLVLALHQLLRFHQGPVVVNLSTSMACEEVARDFGSRLIRTPVGEAHVARAMKRWRAVAGGEGNGGVIHPGLHLGRDAPVAAALILSLLADGERDPRKILARLSPTHMVKSRVGLPRDRMARLRARLVRRFRDARRDQRDGIRLSWPDRWLHVRASGTEPGARIIAEARTRKEARELAAEALRQARSLARP